MISVSNMSVVLPLFALIAFGFIMDAAGIDISKVVDKRPLIVLMILMVGRAFQVNGATVRHTMGLQQVILSCVIPSMVYREIFALSAEQLAVAWKWVVCGLFSCVWLGLGGALLVKITGFAQTPMERNTVVLMFGGVAHALTTLPYSFIFEVIPPQDLNVAHVTLAGLGHILYGIVVPYMVGGYQKNQTTKSSRKSLQGIVAMEAQAGTSRLRAVYKILVTLIADPFIMSALVPLLLVAVGSFRLEQQSIFGDAVVYISKLGLPVTFVLIGIKMKFQLGEQVGIMMLVIYRSGVAFLFTALMSFTLFPEPNEVMFWVVWCNASIGIMPLPRMIETSSSEAQALRGYCQQALQQLSLDATFDAVTQEWLKEKSEEVRLGNTSPADAIVAAKDMLGTTQQVNALISSNGTNASTDATKLGCFELRPSVHSEEDFKTIQDKLDILLQLPTTYDVPFALVMLAVSYTWTVSLLTVISFTPVAFWTHPLVSPVVGVVLFLIGGGYATYKGRQFAAEAEQQMSAMPGCSLELARQRIGRKTIMNSSTVDMFTAVEAQTEVQRAMERDQFFHLDNTDRATEIVDYAKRVCLAATDPNTMGAEDRASWLVASAGMGISSEDGSLGKSVGLRSFEESFNAEVVKSRGVDCGGVSGTTSKAISETSLDMSALNAFIKDNLSELLQKPVSAKTDVQVTKMSLDEPFAGECTVAAGTPESRSTDVSV